MHAFAITLAALAAATAAAAQDPNATPNYGTVRLHGVPDPHVVDLRSGGLVEASRLGDGCAGYVSNAPDVRLTYQAGTLPLTVRAVSDADTMLLVNAPDGSWHCNDDAAAGTNNPAIRFTSPQSGRYEIWVGTRAGSETHPARLEISELDER